MKWLLLDVDGCITDGKGQPIDLTAMQALKDAVARAQCVTGLCTGRSASYVEAIAQMLDLRSWCICENGAYLYHIGRDEMVYHPAIKDDDLARLAAIRHRLTSEPAFVALAKLELGKAVCVSVNPRTMRIADLYTYLRAHLDLDGLHIAHSTTAVDITPRHINKGHGLRFLCEREGLALADVIGVGDSMGDMPFLTLCGMVACPANASSAVKALASFVSAEQSTRGVVDIYSQIPEQSRQN